MDLARIDAVVQLIASGRPKVTQRYRRRGVPRSLELRRINGLARRSWTKDEIDEAVEVLTEELRTPNGNMRLWPLQAQAIAEVVDNRGALLPVPAGDGKALISLLSPTLLDADRPLLLVPAHLREQTKRVVIPEMRRHWRIRDDIRVVGYSELSLAKNADMLERIDPGSIMSDEVHYLKHLKSGRTKRMKRFMKTNPEVVFAGMSGTITQRSLRDYAHIVEWTHGTLLSPLPVRYQDLQDWCSALDESVKEESRLEPGALMLFAEGEETAAQGFRRRLVETPGIVFGDSTSVTTALSLCKKEWPAPPAALPHLTKLRDEWEDPNGDAVMEVLDIWRKGRQLSLGFWLRWDPAAPRDWLDARKAWGRKVRATLDNNRRGLDTPLQVFREQEREHGKPTWGQLHEPDAPETTDPAVYTSWQNKCATIKLLNAERKAKHDDEVEEWKKTLNPGHCDWCAWLAIRDTFKPNSVAEWIDESIAEKCAQWAKTEKGIVWVENPVFGEKVAELAGAPYFGAGDERIMDWKGGPIVASLRAHGTGRNLQDRWHKMLFTSTPSSNNDIEQGLARCHRAGQKSDEVEAYFVLGEDEQMASLRKAISQAHYVKATIGTKQRLLYGTYDFEIPGESP